MCLAVRDSDEGRLWGQRKDINLMTEVLEAKLPLETATDSQNKVNYSDLSLTGAW